MINAFEVKAFYNVRVHLPLQQGLRRKKTLANVPKLCSASASSITTRIKTSLTSIHPSQLSSVRVHLPLQQGLRRLFLLQRVALLYVRVHLPLQQGLRQRFDQGYSHCFQRASASSITTRIKTGRFTTTKTKG